MQDEGEKNFIVTQYQYWNILQKSFNYRKQALKPGFQIWQIYRYVLLETSNENNKK